MAAPGTPPEVVVVGVDGAPGGWIVAEATAQPFVVRAVRFEATIDPVVRDVAAGRVAVACVDMPIGLPDTGRRACEAAARAELGRRRSSVFWTPPRAVLDWTDDYTAAASACRRAGGLGLSRQSFHLLAKVAELDRALDGVPADVADRVRESHPELVFARLLGAPGAYPKRTAAGVAERLVALEGLGVDWRRWLAEPPAGGGDDVVDALALAEAAAGVAVGGPVVVLGDGERDARGRAMSITG